MKVIFDVNLCRICQSRNGQIPINEFRNDMMILDLIVDFSNIQIDFAENSPKSICKYCRKRLENAHALKQLIIKSELLFKNLLNENTDCADKIQCSADISVDLNEIAKEVKPETNEINLKEEDFDIPLDVQLNDISSDLDIKAEIDYFHDNTFEDEKDDDKDEEDDEKFEEKQEESEDKEDKKNVDKKLIKKRSSKRKKDGIDRRRRRGELKCENCGKQFRTSTSYLTHMRSHTGEKPYECNVCSKKFTNSGSLFTHKKTHLNEKNFMCEVCSKQFASLTYLRQHKISHLPDAERILKCEKCNKIFRTKRCLTYHLMQHDGIKSISCSDCGKTFYKQRDLSRHRQTVHLLIKKHVCSVCDHAFSNSGNLVAHFRVHTGEKPYQCNYCDARFNQSTPHVRHTQRHVERGDFPLKSVVSPSKLPTETILKEEFTEKL